jgi:predicted O-linked N-acetylglucosamine transferase (SPINDLY family)
MSSIDYFISCDAMEPPEAQAQYTERLIRLKAPAAYYPRPRLTSTRTRGDFDLPENARLYGCLQMLRKFHPQFDDVIARVLRRDPQGMLLLVRHECAAWNERLLARFRRQMPDVVERIRFLPRLEHPDFLAVTSLCDAMLDPLHFGGGNTTYEALAFGVPVITLPSKFLRGRISYALYQQMGVHEYIARDMDHYVDVAIGAAADSSARQRMAQASGVIFENAAGVRELEASLISAVDSAAAG